MEAGTFVPNRHRVRRRHGVATVLATTALILAGAAPAAANHIAGATYNGTAGSSPLSFAVTPDGAGISSLSIPGPLQGNFCSYSGISATYVVPLPIVNEAFSDTTPPLTISGSFPGVQSAQGTLRMRDTFPPYCDTGSIPWSATTTATPPATATPTIQKKKCKKGQRKVKVNGKVKCKKKKK